MKALTPQQRQVLRIIGAQIEQGGRPPTLREIMRELGLSSTCTAFRHVEALERKGYLARSERYAYRSHTLTPEGWRELRLGNCPGCKEPAGAPLLRDAAGQAWHQGCAGVALAGLRGWSSNDGA